MEHSRCPKGTSARANPRQGICPGGILVAKDPAMHAGLGYIIPV